MAPSAHAAVVTWDGGGATNNWSEAANWSGDVAPTSSDVATFDGTSTKDVTVNGSISVLGVDVETGYTGTITQAAAITLGSSGWDQADGTFQGDSSSITVNGPFLLAGGTFASTSGTLTLNRSTSGELWSVSGGTFTHNSGTVALTGIGNGATGLIDFSATVTTNNITINAGHGNGSVSIGTGDTLRVNGNLALLNGKLECSGALELHGSITSSIGFDGGRGNIWVTGTDSRTISLPAGSVFPGLTLDAPNVSIVTPNSGTLTFHPYLTIHDGTFIGSGGSISLGTNSFTNPAVFRQSGGAFIALRGTLTVTGPNANETIFTSTGGTFLHNSGTVVLGGLANSRVGTIRPSTSIEFHNLSIAAAHGGATYAVHEGTAVVVQGVLALSTGKLDASGTGVQLLGDLTIGAAAAGGSAGLVFTGSANQILTSNGGTAPTGNVTIDKTAGTVSLASNLSFNSSGQDMTLSGGTLDLAGYTLTVNDLFNVGTGTTLRLQGNETITGGVDYVGRESTIHYYHGAASASNTLLDLTYENLIIGSTGATVFTLPATTLNVLGNLTISGGTLRVTSANVISLSGAWLKTTNGTFTAGTGSVILAGGNQSMSGSTTFYNQTKSATATGTLTIAATTTQTVAGTLTLTSQTGTTLRLRSSQPGTQWKIDPQDGRNVRRLDVQDSNNINAAELTCGLACIDSGNNVNWSLENDVTPPNLSALTSTDVTPSAATISWTTDEASDTQVEYGTTTTYGSGMTTLDGALVTSHEATVSGLIAETIYYYRAGSKDGSGNTGTATGSFTTTEDVTAPVVSIMSPAANSTASGGAVIVFTDDELTDPECSVDGSVWTSCTSGTTTLFLLSGWSDIAVGSGFTLSLRDIDPSGNTGSDLNTNITKAGSGLPEGAHPRIWLTPDRLAELEAKRDGGDADWQDLLAYCEDHKDDTGYDVPYDPQEWQSTWNGSPVPPGGTGTGYRGSGYSQQIISFALCYQALKTSDPTAADEYAEHAIDVMHGLVNSFSVGEEVNGLAIIRVGEREDGTINADEAAALGINQSNYKLGYSARNAGVALPLGYDWLHEKLTDQEKEKFYSVMYRWIDWYRGDRTAYNNGVLASGTRYYEDQDGDCTGSNNCTSVTGVLTKGYDHGTNGTVAFRFARRSSLA